MKFNLIDNEAVIMQKLQEGNHPIYIYGAGDIAKSLANFLQSKGFSVEAYCVDDAYYKEGLTFSSRPVIPIGNLNHLETEYHLFLGIGDSAVAKKAVVQNSALHDIFFVFNVGVWVPDRAFCDTYRQRFSYLTDALADQLSKDILWSWLETKISGNVKAHLPYCTDETYFNSLVDVHGGGAFVDCGAYDGDTIKSYIKFFGGYEKIYAFEPDEKNFVRLEENLKGMDRIVCIPKGAWDKEEMLRFTAEGSMLSEVDQNGNVEVPVTSIDKVVGNEKIHFIKMDIEGSELKALYGAEKTIRQNMPILEICVYHKEEDLEEIPRYIMGFNRDKCKYNLYLRHHNCTAAELVLYAIPTVVD